MDNSLIKELSPEKLYLNTNVVIRLFLSLGVLRMDKSMTGLIPPVFFGTMKRRE
jgi:hypothetical protein